MNKLVSLITRTQSRPLFIPRVFKTVIEQSYRPIEWIIVNDNGESIDALIEELKLQYTAQLDGIEISLINKEKSTGMEGASNTGLEHAHGFYIKLLDDDDTLDFACIEKQVYYMENEKLPNERGVICCTQKIFEKIEGDQFLYVKSTSLEAITTITVADLAERNRFSVHALMYERDALKEVGYYNEAFPVLGDWEFNLRFIMEYDIGVVPEFLVNYHIRIEENGANTNTSLALLERYVAALRNQFFRKEKKHPNIVSLIVNGPTVTSLERKLDTVLHQLDQNTNKQALLFSQLFLDLGDGYNEESSLKISMVQNSTLQTLIFDVSGYDNLTNFRLDPLNEACVIEIEELKIIYLDGTAVDLAQRISTNDCAHDGKSYFFSSTDPIITFEELNANELQNTIKLHATIRYIHIGRDALEVCVKQIKSELDQTKTELEQTKTELEQTKTELEQTKTELEQTKTELEQTKAELEQIEGSLSWRLTKPLRKIKQILKGNE